MILSLKFNCEVPKSSGSTIMEIRWKSFCLLALENCGYPLIDGCFSEASAKAYLIMLG